MEKAVIKVYGIRGTVPVCEEEYKKYGGNTACVSIILEDKILIFDAGTGIRKLAEEWKEERKEYHIFLSHLHMDHIQGLPLFAPLYDKKAKVTIYGMKKDGKGIRSRLGEYLHTSLWPVGDEVFACQLKYRELSAGDRILIEGKDEISVKIEQINHPGGAIGYRTEIGKTSFVYALDYEHGEGGGKTLGALAKGADIMIYDGQYFPEEYESKRGWGHSTWEEGRRLQEEYGIRELLVGHHEPLHKDTVLEAEERRMKEKYPKGICFLKEGMEICIEKD